MLIFFQTICLWTINFGIKPTWNFVKLNPSYFLLGIFSPFMVSKETLEDGRKVMSISRSWTWVNLFLSISGSITGHFLNWLVANDSYLDSYSRRLEQATDFALVSFPTFIPTILCLAILFHSIKCCSSCCKANLPIMYKTGVNPNDFSQIDMQTGQECVPDEVDSNLEMQEGSNHSRFLTMPLMIVPQCRTLNNQFRSLASSM